MDEGEEDKSTFEKPNLEVMSVDALGEYIQELEAEILRVRQAISAKGAARSIAESFFKKAE